MFNGVIYEMKCVDKFNGTVLYSVNYINEV
jgi:hypothetical protein